MTDSWYGLHIRCAPEWVDIVMAELNWFDFSSFEETPEGLVAFMQESPPVEAIREQLSTYPIEQIRLEEIEKVNWNEAWESAYEPIEIGSEVVVRATFHDPRPDVRFELVVNPKMSFGTGHHATTSMMLQGQLELDHSGRILDYGTGTGILAILAEKLGASEVLAIDIDSWCIENSEENYLINGTRNIRSEQMDIGDLPEQDQFHGVLANINRNVLLDAMPKLWQHVRPTGWLLLSGVIEEDEAMIRQAAEAQGFKHVKNNVKDGWVCAQFLRP